MNAVVINPNRTISSFAAIPSDNGYAKRYGEVFIIQRHTAILRCCLCEAEHVIYQQFLEHIFEHYYSGMGITAARTSVDTALTESVAKEEIVLEEPKYTSAACIQPVKVAPKPQSKEPTDINALFEIPVELKEELVAEVQPTEDKMPLVENVNEIPSFREKDDPVRANSDSSREPSPFPQPKRKYKRKKPFVKKQLDKYNERTHKCETCSATFKTSRALDEHNRRHAGETRYECEVCKKGFYTSGELTVHKRRHTGERPFVCKYCGGRFTSSGWRGRHEKQHERRLTNARSYKCEICEMGFNEAVHLKKHMVVHSGERNHICSVCNAAFTHRKNLQNHIKLHVNAREYVCNICGRAFNQPCARLLHMKNKHKVVDAANVKSSVSISSTSKSEQSNFDGKELNQFH